MTLLQTQKLLKKKIEVLCTGATVQMRNASDRCVRGLCQGSSADGGGRITGFPFTGGRP